MSWQPRDTRWAPRARGARGAWQTHTALGTGQTPDAGTRFPRIALGPSWALGSRWASTARRSWGSWVSLAARASQHAGEAWQARLPLGASQPSLTRETRGTVPALLAGLPSLTPWATLTLISFGSPLALSSRLALCSLGSGGATLARETHQAALHVCLGPWGPWGARQAIPALLTPVALLAPVTLLAGPPGLPQLPGPARHPGDARLARLPRLPRRPLGTPLTNSPARGALGAGSTRVPLVTFGSSLAREA